MTTENDQPSDEALARRAQSGCAASFEELVFRYEARVFRFIRNNSRTVCDAQEITQDAFVTAFRSLDKFDADRSFATWLFTIARRKCIDHHRAARPVAETVLPEEADENDPAAVLAQREAEQDLWQLAQRALSAAQFEVLWLRHAEDLSVADVARVLGRTQTHVKVLLFRARLRLDGELTRQRAVAVRFGDAAFNGSEKMVSITPSQGEAARLLRGLPGSQTGVST